MTLEQIAEGLVLRQLRMYILPFGMLVGCADLCAR